MSSQLPALVKIPGKEHREQLKRPDRRKTDGHTLIEDMVYNSLRMLPDDGAELSLAAEPPSKWPPPQRTVHTVIHAKGSDALQLPEYLQSLQWTVPLLLPWLPAAKTFDGAFSTKLYYGPHVSIQRTVGVQLDPEVLQLCSAARGGIAASEPVYCDLVMYSMCQFYSFVEGETLLSAAHPCWNQFPFGPSAKERDLLINLDERSSRRMLNQCIAKAQLITAETKKKNVLVALSLPPVRLYYLLIDFEAGTVTVSDNAAASEPKFCGVSASDTDSATLQEATDTSFAERVAKQIVDPDAWRAYWKSAFWFHFVAVAFCFPASIQEAVDADAALGSTKLPPALPQRLQDACNVLREVPPPRLWATLRLRAARWIHDALACVVDAACALWILLTLTAMSTESLLNMSKSVRIPRTGTLELRNGLRYKWCPAILPDCEEKWSYHQNKRFYVYPSLKILVKIFSRYDLSEFENEVKVFHRLIHLQGKGIPKLYGSGKITETDELCLVMSYEGEPLKKWDDDNRSHVEKLVRLLHEHKVHHHDVAPRNVVVDNRGRFTLIDFGLSVEECDYENCTEEKNLGIDGEDY